MTDHELLYRRIISDPFDDTLRLAYADALDEYHQAADPTAAHLRARIRRRACTCDGVCPTCNTDADVIHNALRTVLPAYVGVEDHNGKRYRVPVWYDRGLVDTVTVDPSSFLGVCRDLFRRYPVTCVRLTDMHPYRARIESPSRFWWRFYPERRFRHPSHLPGLLVSYFDGTAAPWHPDGGYDSVLHALAALSRALVRFGREQAGLPSVVFPEEY